MIGLGSYAYFWRRTDRVPAPLGVVEMLEDAARLGAEVFQFCDQPEVLGLAEAELSAVATVAREGGLALELGTRGIRARQLDPYLDLAARLGVRVIRTMVYTADDRPGYDEAAELLGRAAVACAERGVVLALETYEQLPVDALARIVEAVGHPAVGICLDPANPVAAIEHPDATIDRVRGLVVDVHVKDFRFVRAPGLVGFTLEGAPLGTGLLPLDRLLASAPPEAARIVEHWLPWQDDAAATVATEREWTDAAVRLLREKCSTG